MWKIAISILLGFLILSFNYVWINRHYISANEGGTLIINRWTGEACIYFPDVDDLNERSRGRGLKMCLLGDSERIHLP